MSTDSYTTQRDTTRPPAAVRAVTLRFRQQIPALQEILRPAVAPGEPMIAHETFVEMPYGEASIAYPMQTLDFLAPVHRHSFVRRATDPTAQQAGLALVLVAPAPTAESPFADARRLRGFRLVQLRGVSMAN